MVTVSAVPVRAGASFVVPGYKRTPAFTMPQVKVAIGLPSPRVYQASRVQAVPVAVSITQRAASLAFPNGLATRPVQTIAQVRARYFESVSKIISRVAIYTNTGSVLWEAEALTAQRLIDGSVSVDSSRDERRNFDITLSNFDHALVSRPRGFWYDKVLKVYRGVELTDRYGKYRDEYQIGEFLIDKLDGSDFPLQVQATGRDYTKRLLLSKFPQALTFSAGSGVVSTIKNISVNAGITKFNFPSDDAVFAQDYTYERGDSRWKAVKAMATDFGYDLFFDAQGYEVLRKFSDPSTSPVTHTFATGKDIGNLYTYKSNSSDTSLFNHVIVSGEGDNKALFFAEALNTNPASATSIASIGDRVYEYKGQYITSQTQAQSLADALLKINALEEYSINFSGIVAPWLEGGDIVRFLDPDPLAGTEVDRYLLSSFSIPLGLAPMDATGRRVTIVS